VVGEAAGLVGAVAIGHVVQLGVPDAVGERGGQVVGQVNAAGVEQLLVHLVPHDQLVRVDGDVAGDDGRLAGGRRGAGGIVRRGAGGGRRERDLAGHRHDGGHLAQHVVVAHAHPDLFLEAGGHELGAGGGRGRADGFLPLGGGLELGQLRGGVAPIGGLAVAVIEHALEPVGDEPAVLTGLHQPAGEPRVERLLLDGLDPAHRLGPLFADQLVGVHGLAAARIPRLQLVAVGLGFLVPRLQRGHHHGADVIVQLLLVLENRFAHGIESSLFALQHAHLSVIPADAGSPHAPTGNPHQPTWPLPIRP